jgi:hypothetical protein
VKKDITFLPVTGIQIAIVRTLTELATEEWQVMLINRNAEFITNIFVTSRGYGKTEPGDGPPDQKTSTLRHFFPELGPNQHLMVEPILPELFHLTNEYWVSYYLENQIYDKKFIFVPDTISENNLTEIDLLGVVGILHE